jgi:hypothetical protein
VLLRHYGEQQAQIRLDGIRTRWATHAEAIPEGFNSERTLLIRLQFRRAVGFAVEALPFAWTQAVGSAEPSGEMARIGESHPAGHGGDCRCLCRIACQDASSPFEALSDDPFVYM